METTIEKSNVEYLLDLGFNPNQGNPLFHVKGRFERNSEGNWTYLSICEADASHKAIITNPRMLTGIKAILVGNFSSCEKRAEKMEPELVINQAPLNANAVLRSEELFHVPRYPQVIQYRSAIYFHIDNP